MMSGVSQVVPADQAAAVSGKGKAKEDSVATIADAHIRQGKRHLLKGEAVEASECFETAVQLVVEKYGDLADECADAYRFYGTSLLQIAKQENSLLGSGVASSTSATADPIAEASTGDAGSAEAATAGSANAGDEDDEEDLSTEQLAWETLECARIILKRQNSPNASLRLASVQYDLGEYLLETGSFDNAVAEFDECLELRKSHLQGNDRLLAETYYTLALANDHAEKFEAAVNAYTKAIDIMKANIKELEGDAKRVAEAATLKEVVVELTQKVSEATDEMKRRKAASAAVLEPQQASASKDRMDRMTGAHSAGSSTTIGFGSAEASSTNESSSFAMPSGSFKHAAPVDLTARVKKKVRLEPASLK